MPADRPRPLSPTNILLCVYVAALLAVAVAGLCVTAGSSAFQALALIGVGLLASGVLWAAVWAQRTSRRRG